MERHKAKEAGKKSAFVTALKKYRKAAGLTQTALAKKLHVVPSTVSMWETGDSIPSPKLIPKLARLLNVKALVLMNLLEPEPAIAA